MRQTALRAEYEAALAQGQPVVGILAQAAEARVELYDDPAQSVAQLRAQAAVTATRQATDDWGGLLRLSELAWRAGEAERAAEGFRAVAEADASPPALREQARLAVALLEKGVAWSDTGENSAIAAGQAGGVADEASRRRRRFLVLVLAFIGGLALLSALIWQGSQLRLLNQRLALLITPTVQTLIPPIATATSSSLTPPTEPAPTAATLPSATLRITLDPPVFDLGVYQKAILKAMVTALDDGAPVTNTLVTLRVEPAGLATIAGQATYQGTTDDSNGELTAELTFGPVTGAGKLVVYLVEGTKAEAPIMVRPVAHNKQAPYARLYVIPSAAQVSFLREAAKDERLPIVGATTVGGVVWYQVRLPDDGMAWTSTKAGDASAPIIEGDVMGLPSIDPQVALKPSTAAPTTTPTSGPFCFNSHARRCAGKRLPGGRKVPGRSSVRTTGSAVSARQPDSCASRAACRGHSGHFSAPGRRGDTLQ